MTEEALLMKRVIALGGELHVREDATNGSRPYYGRIDWPGGHRSTTWGRTVAEMYAALGREVTRVEGRS